MDINTEHKLEATAVGLTDKLTDKATAYLKHMLQAGYVLTVEYDQRLSLTLVALVHLEHKEPLTPKRVGDEQFNEIRIGGGSFADALNRLADPGYYSECSEAIDQALDALYAKKTGVGKTQEAQEAL